MHCKLHWVVFLSILILITCSKQNTGIDIEDTKRTEMFAFTDVNLVPMTEDKVIGNQTVLIDGTRIIEIGPTNEVVIPDKANIIEGKGAYLMPGLADMHVHILRDIWPVPQFNLNLANGVTTIRSLGTTADENEHKIIVDWRNQILEGSRVGPNICTTCPPIIGSESNPWELVARYHDEGFDCIKFFSLFSKVDFTKAIDAAKEKNMYTIGHIPTAVGFDGVIEKGMGEIAHISELALELIDFDRTKKYKEGETWKFIGNALSEQYDLSNFKDDTFQKDIRRKISEIVDELRFSNIPVHTTLFIFEDADTRLFKGIEKLLNRPESKYLPKKVLQELSKGNDWFIEYIKQFNELWHFLFEVQKIFLMELNNEGIPLVLGTDVGIGIFGIVPGYCVHDELRVLTESGLTPYQAIATGTVNASKVFAAMNGRDDFGTIEVGKRADFILVNKNPLEDVGNIQDNRGVMSAGKWYSNVKLREMISITD